MKEKSDAFIHEILSLKRGTHLNYNSMTKQPHKIRYYKEKYEDKMCITTKNHLTLYHTYKKNHQTTNKCDEETINQYETRKKSADRTWTRVVWIWIMVQIYLLQETKITCSMLPWTVLHKLRYLSSCGRDTMRLVMLLKYFVSYNQRSKHIAYLENLNAVEA